jgi:ElaB/YqjD/DUF883 family membrane-anchored ribosome-binding protein
LPANVNTAEQFRCPHGTAAPVAGLIIQRRRAAMNTQNRSLAGAGEAIERTKDSFGDAASEAESTARDTLSKASESAQQMYDDARDSLTRFSHDSYDFVGETVRAGEDYARRKPIQALTIAAMAGAFVGFVFAVRAAPRASRRYFSGR